MRVYLHEISEEDKELHFNGSEPWMVQVVSSLDEQGSILSPPPKAEDKKARAGTQADFNLTKVDDVVIVQGQVDAPVKLICSRCATPYLETLHPDFRMFFTKDPVLAGLDKGGKARHEHDSSDSDVDITLLKQEYVDLSEVLYEQLQLALPVQPLCKADCKGICSNCGADLNKGRCACDKIVKTTPLAALKDFKTKPSKASS